ncbi:MAG: TolC family protein [Burkholderiales bacterium]|nr:TolC family protein [Burkholderiales bacterium]
MIACLAQRLQIIFLALVTVCFPLNLAAQDDKPLTLEQALQAADAAHPDLQIAQAEREMALADQTAAGARRDLSVSLEGRLQQAQSSLPDAKFSADNSVRLLARKNLYDFGRTSSAESAASAVVDARDLQLIDVRDLRRLDIMARYFDVLITDMQYISDNEYMTVWYFTFDRARERYEQKLASKVEVAEAEARFQDFLVKRNETQRRQRLSRAMLADAMNQPGQLPSELADPALASNDRPLPEYEELLKLIEQNPKFKANQQLLEASRQRLEAVRADKNPTLDLELEANEYANRKLSGRDEYRAGVVLSWPLYQGNRVSSQLAREQAQFHKLQAENEKYKRSLMSATLAVWIEVEQLQKTARNAAKVQADYRDLSLERARALYEVELRTTLGETMASTADAKLRQRSVEYKLALAFAKLEALLGQPLPAPVKK